ncbi:response regulator transcription factor [Bifidobacterium sp. ESL0790]|uniref:response regulator n=1 Tax=Bifidobacterium sp. ESL0790 TaxID=2983233 RepID=UPI0023F82AF8|nr:response regulator transcription factor [Bifidobacterium sp. ESL0790]WEV72978.1 response regulator transcription factor [Bifidobacterium sp. ESL0790]
MSETQPITVLIADDQELVRAGFAMVIDSQPDMEVIGQAANGDQAVSLSLDLHPDVVLMDVRMPGMDGIEATKRITDAEAFLEKNRDGNGSTMHKTRVIILTTFDLDEYVMSAINAGASGFLLKDTEPETLLSSIRTVHQGNAIIAPTATKRLIEKMVEDGFTKSGQAASGNSDGKGNGANRMGAANGSAGAGSQPTTSASANDGNASSDDLAAANATVYHDPELDELTDREREVLIEVAHGLSNQEIADKLFISLPTVKTHVAHILAKIHARDRVQAVVFAYDNQLV